MVPKQQKQDISNISLNHTPVKPFVAKALANVLNERSNMVGGTTSYNTSIAFTNDLSAEDNLMMAEHHLNGLILEDGQIDKYSDQGDNAVTNSNTGHFAELVTQGNPIKINNMPDMYGSVLPDEVCVYLINFII